MIIVMYRSPSMDHGFDAGFLLLSSTLKSEWWFEVTHNIHYTLCRSSGLASVKHHKGR